MTDTELDIQLSERILRSRRGLNEHEIARLQQIVDRRMGLSSKERERLHAIRDKWAKHHHARENERNES